MGPKPSQPHGTGSLLRLALFGLKAAWFRKSSLFPDKTVK
jgi:hypothetical protein